jgi:hypothetical protein
MGSGDLPDQEQPSPPGLPARLVNAAGSTEALSSLRTSTFVGLVWFGVIWVAFGTRIVKASHEKDRVVPLSELSHVFGHVGATIAVALATFLVGAVSLQVFRAPAIWLANLATTVIVTSEWLVVQAAAVLGDRSILRRYEGWRPIAVDLPRRILDDRVSLAGWEGDRHEAYVLIDRAILRELEDPALAGTYLRRLNGRAALRLGLVIPVLVLVLVFAWRLDVWFLVLLPVPLVLGFQAADYRAERDACLTDVVLKKVFR